MSSNVSLASILPDLASPEWFVLPLALKVQWRVCARSILEGPLCKLIQINVQTLEHLVCSRACAGFVRKRFDIGAQIPAPEEGVICWPMGRADGGISASFLCQRQWASSS